jgi:hypothetical protein
VPFMRLPPQVSASCRRLPGAQRDRVPSTTDLRR